MPGERASGSGTRKYRGEKGKSDRKWVRGETGSKFLRSLDLMLIDMERVT